MAVLALVAARVAQQSITIRGAQVFHDHWILSLAWSKEPALTTAVTTLYGFRSKNLVICYQESCLKSLECLVFSTPSESLENKCCSCSSHVLDACFVLLSSFSYLDQ
jgi:hypothetical protein